ncbi:MAG: DNA polymerase I [Alphaproteobacteria bacterium]|nr:DNA polymerase I [Alphaproteobacteria bacterium]
MAPGEGASGRHLFLIDGSGYIFRAFHALPMLTRPDGTPVNAVMGFTTMLAKLIEDTGAHRLAVIFDSARTSFRNEIYPAYKAQRPDPPPELVPQFGLIREAVRAFNVPCIELQGFEADDLIASYARAALTIGDTVTVVSSDKDLMQLVRPGLDLLDPMKNRRIGPAEVVEKFGVPPDKVVDVQALMGDSVDNVPGVPGIGQKTAAELIQTYGDLDTLLARAAEIKQPKRRENLIEYRELAFVSRDLVRLRDDIDLPVPLDGLEKHPPDRAALEAFLRTQGFRGLLAKLGFGGAASTAPSSAPAPAAAGESAAQAASAPAMPASVMAEYELVQDLAALDRWIAVATAQGLVAVDTETTSLDSQLAELVGVSLATAAGRACYIPLAHVGAAATPLDPDAGRPVQIQLEAALARLRPLLADPAVLKVGHNLKYDMAVLERYGVTVTPWDDTMLLSYVLGAGLHGHGMDELAERHLGYKTISYKEVTGSGKSQISFAEVALDKALAYAAEDADITLRLHTLLKPGLVRDRVTNLYEAIERPLIPVVVGMERQGVRVDPDRLRRLSQEFATRLAELEGEIHRLAGHPFAVGSPKQLGKVLFEEQKLPPPKVGKSGDYSTDSSVLEPLAEQGHELPARVLDWRQLAKLKSTYTDALVQQINPRTGRIHTSFALAATATGRLSSTDPNLQNIPVRTEEGRKIRACFIADPGHVLMSADYSQIELRVLADIADIDTLKTAFRDGIDIHAMTASQVFGVPIEGMDPMIRRKAKAINFGIIYGISGFGLARQLGIAQGEAQAFIRAYFERFPGIRAYMDRMKEEARANGYVSTLFGRRVHLRGIQDRVASIRAFAERQAINAPIQGTAADIVKRAMLRLPPALAAAGLSARMVLHVHDELLFEVPEAEVAATSTLVRQVMEAAATLSVPLVADAGTGASWAEAH